MDRPVTVFRSGPPWNYTLSPVRARAAAHAISRVCSPGLGGTKAAEPTLRWHGVQAWKDGGRRVKHGLRGGGVAQVGAGGLFGRFERQRYIEL